MKSGVAVSEPRRPASTPGTRPLHGAIAAGATALVVIAVGLGVLALTRSGAPAPVVNAAAAALPNEEPASAAIDLPTGVNEPPAAAPPSTGTAAVPMPPATGAAIAAKPDGGD
jgi:hypothetical protein